MNIQHVEVQIPILTNNFQVNRKKENQFSKNSNFQDVNKTRENEDLIRMLRLETDLGRYQTFVINTGKVRK
jgi:hypothetical protein